MRLADNFGQAYDPSMAPVARQPSMLDLADEASLGQLAGRVRRHTLSRGAWVDHLPGWVDGSEVVLETLLHDVDWRAERREMYQREVDVPRLLCWYGEDEVLPTTPRSWASRS